MAAVCTRPYDALPSPSSASPAGTPAQAAYVPPPPPALPAPPVAPTAEPLWRLFKRCRELLVVPEVFFCAARFHMRVQEGAGQRTVTQSARDACLLVAMKVWESLDADLFEATPEVKRAEGELCAMLGWRLHPPTLFDTLNHALNAEAPLRLQRVAALLAIVEGSAQPDPTLAAALLRAYRAPAEPIAHPSVRRAARVAVLLDRSDVVCTAPLIIAHTRHFVTGQPLFGRLTVDGGACHGMEVVCAQTAMGTELRFASDAAKLRLMQQTFVVLSGGGCGR